MQTLRAREVSDTADVQRDNYTVVREIGKGTFGIAYLVKNKASTHKFSTQFQPR